MGHKKLLSSLNSSYEQYQEIKRRTCKDKQEGAWGRMVLVSNLQDIDYTCSHMMI